jgi:hypothetical protein
VRMEHVSVIKSFPGWNAHVGCSLEMRVVGVFSFRPDGGEIEHMKLLGAQSRREGSETV